MKYVAIIFLLISASCGKTIKDPSYKSTISFENKLPSDVRLVLFDNGIAAQDVIIRTGKIFEIKDDGLDGPTPRFFFTYDSAQISLPGKMKTDINYPGLKITGLASDTVNIFNNSKYKTESLGENNTKFVYYFNEKDSLEMR